MNELNFNVISLNTRGLGNFTKQKKIFNYVKKHFSRRGIILLQETHSVQKDEKVLTNQSEWGKLSVIFSHGKWDARGVLVAFREAVNHKIISQHADNNGRYIVLNFLTDGSPVILVNYYAPNYEADQVKPLNDLTRVLDQLEITANTSFFVGWWFQHNIDISLDADGGSPQLYIKSVAKLLLMMSENDLSDIFRIRHPDSRRFTWRRKTPFLQRRLDYFLVSSDSLQESIETIDIIPSVVSDHSAILLKLRPTYEGNRGRSYWKFISSLTEDKQFVNSLKMRFRYLKKKHFSHRSNYEMEIS